MALTQLRARRILSTIGSHTCLRRRTSVACATLVSPKTPNTTIGFSPPPTMTQSVQRPPIVYQTRSSHKERLNRCSKQDMTQFQTSCMQGITDSPSPNPTSFNRKHYTLIIVEMGFYRDLGCDIKIEKKTESYYLLIAALNKKLGTGGVHRLPHWPRGYHAHQDPRPPHHRLLRRQTERGEITSHHGRR